MPINSKGIDGIYRDWRSGMSYDDMHVKYGPWNKCECDPCERGRQWERTEEEIENGSGSDEN
jgi:hypothetical protein